MGKPGRPDRRYALAVGAVVAVGLILRLSFIGSNSFWVDEINVLSFVRSGHLLSSLRNRGGPFEPPLHYVAVWLAAFVPIGFEASARIPAAVFGSVEVLAILLLARRLTHRRAVALLAGMFLAVAPFAVRYSQENRYYTTFSALHLLTWWLITRALQLRTRAAFRWWGVGVAALILSHPFAPLVVLVQTGVVAWIVLRELRHGQRERVRSLVQQIVRGVALAVVVIAPWYFWGAIRWVPDLWNGRSYKLNAGPREPVVLQVDLVKRTAQWLLGNGARWTLLSTLLVVLMVSSIALAKRPERRVAFGVGAYGAGFFLALIPLANFLNTYFAMRRIEFLLAPMVLLAALGTVAICDRVRARWRDHPTWPRSAAAITTALVVGLSLVATGAYYATEKTNYRALAAVIAKVPREQPVVVGPVDERWPQSIKEYLAWRGVHRKLHFVVPGRPAPVLALPGGDILWITGSPPGPGGFRTRALNSVPDLQVIAGDRTAPGAVVPWFASVSAPQSELELRAQMEHVATLAVLLPPPEASFPWWLFTGR